MVESVSAGTARSLVRRSGSSLKVPSATSIPTVATHSSNKPTSLANHESATVLSHMMYLEVEFGETFLQYLLDKLKLVLVQK